MPDTRFAAVDQSAPDDLISFLKAILDGRYRRGVRYPQWYLLLVAVLGILSGCRSSRDLEAFARRHREALDQALGLEFKRWPSDATFLYLFNRAHLQEFAQVLQAWMISQIPGGARELVSGCVTARRCGALLLSSRTAVTVLSPKSLSTPEPLAWPWPRRCSYRCQPPGRPICRCREGAVAGS
jgi:hypothetical protein